MMKLQNRLPTLVEIIEVSGKAVLQASGHTLGNSVDVLVISYKNGKIKKADTFGSNLSGLIVQIERMVNRLNGDKFEVIISK